MTPRLKLGTRGSRLALWQADLVAEELKKAIPDLKIEIQIIKTRGDKILDVALSKIGDKGLFTKEIETELLQGNIDLAVHSMKDLPVDIDEDLDIGAVLKREDPRDVLLSHKGWRFAELPPGAVLGTSSLRRMAQLRAKRPDLIIEPLRGNVETRIKKMQEQDWDGIILAWAGVKRLGFQGLVSDFLDLEMVLPAVGQGAVAVQTRKNDHFTRELVNLINHENSLLEVRAERTLLGRLQGGCQVPIGARAEVFNERIKIRGAVCSLDGRRCLRQDIEGPTGLGQELAEELASRLLDQGGREILEEIRGLNS